MGRGLQGSERGWLRLLGSTECCGWLKGKGRTVAVVGRHQWKQPAPKPGLRGGRGDPENQTHILFLWG